MRRRDFITLLGGAAAAWPLAARAQPAGLPVIGLLDQQNPDRNAELLAGFRRGLAEAGYVEGRNVAIDYRWADNDTDRLPGLAAELVARKVTVIGAFNIPAVVAAKAATRTIPIVFVTGSDPVALGFVASLRRPGGNLTGVTTLSVEIGPKRLETLHELAPAATDIAVLVNPTNPINAESQSQALETAARSLGLRIHFLRASTAGEIDAAFARLHDIAAGALLVDADQFLTSRNEQLATLAARNGLPAMGGRRDFAAAGGLVSYGTPRQDSYHDLGVYVGRILKGERPADMPVQQATKFELVINLTAAKALGLTVPLPLSGGADELIE
jgi:putative ABC transport system substrate-binding protein